MPNFRWKEFFALCQMTSDAYQSLPFDVKVLNPDYQGALEIEAARQLSDDGGMPLADAAKLVRNAGANAAHLAGQKKLPGVLYDCWVGIIRSRNTWGSEPRGAYPVTGFGAGEYWASLHVSGTLAECNAQIAYWMAYDESEHPDSDPARIFLVNISAADRRLRKRAVDLGIAVKAE